VHILLLSLMLASTAAQAEPWELAGANIRDMSMAGAGAAGSLPGAAIPMDPGAVAAVDGELFSIGYRRTVPMVEVGGVSLVGGPINALDMTIAFGGPVGTINAGAGFALYLPLPEAVRTKVHMDADELHAPLLEDAVDFASCNLAGGLKFGMLEIAGGAAVGIDLLADTEVSVKALDGDVKDDGSIDITESVDVALVRRLVWAVAPVMGIHLRNHGLHAFLSYRGQSGFRTSGDNEIRFDFESDFLGDLFPDVDLGVDYLSVWTPARVALGVSAPVGRFRPELMARYQWYSRWRDTQNRKPVPGFADVPSVGLGLEADIGRGLMARTGYAVHLSPVSAQTGRSRLADTDRHVVGLGLGWARGGIPRGNDRTELRLGLQGQRLSPRDVGDVQLSGWIWTATTGLEARL
jgi:hypothetical protein